MGNTSIYENIDGGLTYSLKFDKIGKSELRLMISLVIYLSSQTKPQHLLNLTEYFGSKTHLTSVWTGRPFNGSYSSGTVEHYVGLDPHQRESSYL